MSYDKDPNYFSGAIFYLFAASGVLDIIWMVFILPAWGAESPGNKLWESLSTVHTITTICSILELVVKILVLLLIIKRPENESGKPIPELRLYNELLAASAKS